MDVEAGDVAEVIHGARLDEVCYPRSGDCVSVAVAIERVFGGEFICGYELGDDSLPVHAAVEIDGEVFDGTGRTSRQTLYDMAISGLKPSECGVIEQHVGYVKSLVDCPMYDEETSSVVEDRLRDGLDDLG